MMPPYIQMSDTSQDTLSTLNPNVLSVALVACGLKMSNKLLITSRLTPGTYGGQLNHGPETFESIQAWNKQHRPNKDDRAAWQRVAYDFAALAFELVHKYEAPNRSPYIGKCITDLIVSLSELANSLDIDLPEAVRHQMQRFRAEVDGCTPDFSPTPEAKSPAHRYTGTPATVSVDMFDIPFEDEELLQ